MGGFCSHLGFDLGSHAGYDIVIHIWHAGDELGYWGSLNTTSNFEDGSRIVCATTPECSGDLCSPWFVSSISSRLEISLYACECLLSFLVILAVLGREDRFFKVSLGHADQIEIWLGQIKIVRIRPIANVGSVWVIER